MDHLFSKQGFSDTWKFYEEKIHIDSSDAELNYKLGMCYLGSRSQKEKAIPYLQKALRQKGDRDIPLLTDKLLAEAFYLNGNFSSALSHFENYKKWLLSQKGSKRELKELDSRIEICRDKKEIHEMRELMTLLANQRFGKNNSTSYSDYSVSGSPDSSSLTLVFKRSFLNGKALKDSLFFEDSGIPKIPDMSKRQLNKDTSKTGREATVATSFDGQIILTYRDDDGEANLYTSMLNGNEWGKPQRLARATYEKGWEPDEFLSADGNTIYFTSSRAGGLGGKDIYKSVKLSNGEWSKAVNPGYPINTPFDEEAPFLHPDGVTLFFSSNRYRDKGGFDLFKTSLSDSGWSPPIDVGYPIAKKTTGENDPDKENYLVTFINSAGPPLTLAKGKVTGPNNHVLSYAKITVADNETGSVTGVYHADLETGQYIIILPPGKNNNITFESEGYLFQSENMNAAGDTALYRLTMGIELEPLKEGSENELNNIFFTEDPLSIHTHSQTELNTLFRLLESNPGLCIDICVSDEKRKKKDKDPSLPEKKINLLADYLAEQGIEKERISTRIHLRTGKKKNRKQKKGAQITVSNKISIRVNDIKN